MQKLNQIKLLMLGTFFLANAHFNPAQAQERMNQYGIEKSKDWICKEFPGPLAIREYTLTNGLTVVFSKNPNEPKVVTQIAVKAGSKNDPATNTGLAHYLEHMLFKGTDKYGTLDFEKEKVYLAQIENLYEQYNSTKDEAKRKKIYAAIDSVSGLASQHSIANEYDKMVQAIGASGTNAYTSVEQTVYVNTIPHNEIHRWLEIEAERFRNPIMRLFHTELEAVYEEKNISMDNDYSNVFETMDASLFKKHNYGLQTTIGTVEHLKNPSLVKIREYYNTYYVPNNMAIIMSGDFGYDSTIAMIVEHFSYMKAKPVPEYKYGVEPLNANPKEITITGKMEPSVWLGFRLPGFNTKELMMAEMVDMLLNNSQAGLFDLNLVKAQKVLRAGCYMNQMKDYSVHFMYGNPKEGQTLSEVKDLMTAELQNIKEGKFSDTLLKSIILDYSISKMKAYEGNNGRVNDLTSSFIYEMNWMDFQNRLYFQSQMTKADIVAFANEYYNSDYTIIYKEQGTPEQSASIEKPTITPVELNRGKSSDFVTALMKEGSTPIKPVFADVEEEIQKTALGNVPLWYVQNKTNELFTMYYVLDMGKYHNKMLPLAINYIAYVGTAAQNANDLANAFYELGSTFSVSAGAEESYVYLSGIQKNFDASLKLFENLLRNPVANKGAFDNMIADLKTERKNAKTDKNAILGTLRAYALYGKENPSNYELSDEELDAISANQLIGLIKNLFNYQHTIMYYGPAAIDLVSSSLKTNHTVPLNWTAIPAKKEFIPIENKIATVYFAQYDDMVQAQIAWIKRSSIFNADQLPISALHREYFGGGMSGVVFQTIRESKSLAYSSYSVYGTANKKDKYNTVFSYIGTQSDKLKEAVIGMNELHKDLPLAESNFNQAKAAVISEMNTERLQNANLFWFNRSMMDMGLTQSYKPGMYDKVQELQFQDLKNFHATNYGKTPFNYAILGDKTKLNMDFLKTLGTVAEIDLKTLFGY